MKGGSMLLPHNKVSGGVQDSQIMIPSFFDRFYVMPPLTNGVHYMDIYVSQIKHYRNAALNILLSSQNYRIMKELKLKPCGNVAKAILP